ncbi:hypothetical protein [Streptomyces sp. NPDC049555]|uniref:hypothetical protein n=1 Tax=unclassified Streptomyces TaxID=2593676 RepID=UPI00343024BE
MSDEIQAKEALKLAQWHLSRADQLRLGLVSRTSALLSANALVIAGAVLVSSSPSSRLAPIIWGSTLVVLTMSTYSVVQATGVLTGPLRGRDLSRPPGFPPSLSFSYKDTLDEFSDPLAFRDGFMTQSTGDATRSALLELWRCMTLHQLRMARLHRATRSLLASTMVLIATAAERMAFQVL